MKSFLLGGFFYACLVAPLIFYFELSTFGAWYAFLLALDGAVFLSDKLVALFVSENNNQ